MHKSGKTVFRAILCAFLAAGGLRAGTKAPQRMAGQFNPDDYPRETMAKLLSREPCRSAGMYEIKDRLFSAELSYSGDVHQASSKHLELVRRWAQTLGDPMAAEKYRNEVSLDDGKKQHWVVVPDGLLPELKAQLQPRDRTLLYLVLIGCVDREPVFAVDDFESAMSDPDDVYVVRDQPVPRSLL